MRHTVAAPCWGAMVPVLHSAARSTARSSRRCSWPAGGRPCTGSAGLPHEQEQLRLQIVLQVIQANRRLVIEVADARRGNLDILGEQQGDSGSRLQDKP